MRKQVPVLLLLFALLPAAAWPQSAPAKAILIKAGRVLDVKAGAYRTNQAVLVVGGRIQEVGAPADVQAHAPKDAELLDLSRAAVLPGLIDCHAHLLTAGRGGLGPGDIIVLTITEMSPAKRALLGAANAREMLDAGFTTVRNVGHSGVDGDAALRDAINAGWVSGPRILAATRKLTPPGGQAVALQAAVSDKIIEQEFFPVSGPEEARRAVREALYSGADVIKVVMDAGARALRSDEIKAIVDEAHASRIRVAVHATGEAAIRAAVDAGVDSVEHGDEATDETLRLMRDKGVILVPTAWQSQGLRKLVTESFRLSPEELAKFDSWLKNWTETTTNRLQRAMKLGVKIAAGSDMWFAYPGKTRGQATLLMLYAMRDQGMSSVEVLRAATVNAAELLGWQDRVGSVEAGRFADLVAVEGDPLQDLSALERVKFVMKGGAVVKNEFK